MRRLLAPAFLTTVSLASACTKKPIEDGNTHNPPYIEPDAGQRTQNPPAVRDSGGPTVEEKPTKKRRRTAAASYQAAGKGTTTANLKQLNPLDGNGRPIQAMADDRCAVEVPFKGPMPSRLPPGYSPKSYEYVDCPAEMDDPAWDDCTSRLAIEKTTLSCFCLPDGGNPPPPPRMQKCPATAKETAKKP